jgi:acetylserotonin N-methyltransferase
MHSHSLPAATGVARFGDFRGVRKLLDVGGGSGCFCIMLAHSFPGMRFTVLELPAVREFTVTYVAEAGLADRISVVGADMFGDQWPAGHDAMLLSNILHDWDEKRCLWLCHRCYEMLPAGGSIYVHTMLLADTKDNPLTTVAFSMNMVVRTEGKQFSAQELKKLVKQSGFTDVSITPTFGYYSLLRARKPLD